MLTSTALQERTINTTKAGKDTSHHEGTWVQASTGFLATNVGSCIDSMTLSVEERLQSFLLIFVYDFTAEFHMTTGLNVNLDRGILSFTYITHGLKRNCPVG